MADAVINHGSSESLWFKNFIKGKGKGSDYFLNFDESFDSPKLFDQEHQTYFASCRDNDGQSMYGVLLAKIKLITTSAILLYYLNFIQIIIFYLSKGITVFRFDAVAFIWKKKRVVSICENYEIVRL